MKRYGWATSALALALVTAFAAVEAPGVAVLIEPELAMSRGGTTAGLVGVGLLVVGAVSGATLFVAVLALAGTFRLVSSLRDDAPRPRRM